MHRTTETEMVTGEMAYTNLAKFDQQIFCRFSTRHSYAYLVIAMPHGTSPGDRKPARALPRCANDVDEAPIHLSTVRRRKWQALRWSGDFGTARRSAHVLSGLPLWSDVRIIPVKAL
ncbi:hypothetical protein BHE75_03141 [Sphingomonas haloaromaticamans]|uniref:Uncharacterized protein n=3 Tax=Rhizorhabdaceae TaxID=3423714 RepID=A0A1S1HI83_9SPHN|nr:hypothetical protein BHE75_03141 [Sphingomonas haloaromaticamans]